jgi:spore maturation protein CgeB
MQSKNLKILYAGGLFKGSTGRERLNAIMELGYDVITFDFDPFVRRTNRIKRIFENRLNWGPDIWALNSELLKFAKGVDYDLVWVSKGIWIYPQTVQELKKNAKCIVVHFTPDAQILSNRTRHFIKSIPFYDLHITSKPWEVELYKKYGAKKVVSIPQGVNLDLLKPYEVSGTEYERFKSDACFIGHYERHYEFLIGKAYEIGADVALWGPIWKRHLLFSSWLRKIFRGPGVWHEDYAKAICCTKIGLGFLSKLCPETATTRTFEIPACGTFLLAERTDEHLQYFKEGEEAEFFGCFEEMQDKIKYYLKNDELRRKIARQGMDRCRRSGYGNLDRMRQSFEAAFGDRPV